MQSWVGSRRQGVMARRPHAPRSGRRPWHISAVPPDSLPHAFHTTSTALHIEDVMFKPEASPRSLVKTWQRQETDPGLFCSSYTLCAVRRSHLRLPPVSLGLAFQAIQRRRQRHQPVLFFTCHPAGAPVKRAGTRLPKGPKISSWRCFYSLQTILYRFGSSRRF